MSDYSRFACDIEDIVYSASDHSIQKTGQDVINTPVRVADLDPKQRTGEWVVYEGPRGGVGYRNTRTQEIRYTKRRPGIINLTDIKAGKPIRAGKVRKITDTFTQSGFDIFIVGESVRNSFLELPIDKVRMVTNAPPKKIREVLSISGHITTEEEEAVGEFNFEDGNQKMSIETYRDTSTKIVIIKNTLQEALANQKISIDSIAYNPIDGTIVDIYDGIKDLQERKIRIVKQPLQVLNDDPSLIVYISRVIAEIGGNIDEGTYQAFLQAKMNALSQDVVPKIRYEFLKGLNTEYPEAFISMLIRTNLAKLVFSELEKMKNTDYDDEKTLLRYSIDIVKSLPRDFYIRFIALFHNIDNVEEILKRLDFPENDHKFIMDIVNALPFFYTRGMNIQDAIIKYGKTETLTLIDLQKAIFTNKGQQKDVEELEKLRFSISNVSRVIPKQKGISYIDDPVPASFGYTLPFVPESVVINWNDKTISFFNSEESIMKEWIHYTGPHGGRGWRNTQTQEIRYQVEKPRETEGGEKPQPSQTQPQPSQTQPPKSVHVNNEEMNKIQSEWGVADHEQITTLISTGQRKEKDLMDVTGWDAQKVSNYTESHLNPRELELSRAADHLNIIPSNTKEELEGKVKLALDNSPHDVVTTLSNGGWSNDQIKHVFDTIGTSEKPIKIPEIDLSTKTKSHILKNRYCDVEGHCFPTSQGLAGHISQTKHHPIIRNDDNAKTPQSGAQDDKTQSSTRGSKTNEDTYIYMGGLHNIEAPILGVDVKKFVQSITNDVASVLDKHNLEIHEAYNHNYHDNYHTYDEYITVINYRLFDKETQELAAVMNRKLYMRTWEEGTHGRRRAEIIFHRDIFKIKEQYTGGGIGTDLEIVTMHHIQDIANSSRLPVNIEMTANLDVGGYTWAKFGYNTSSDRVKESLVNYLKNKLDALLTHRIITLDEFHDADKFLTTYLMSDDIDVAMVAHYGKEKQLRIPPHDTELFDDETLSAYALLRKDKKKAHLGKLLLVGASYEAFLTVHPEIVK